LSLPGRPHVAEIHRTVAAAELLPAPCPDAPTCACCTPDPARRAALARLRVQRDRLAAARATHQRMPLRVGCCGSRRRAA
jgi:hypothetical protein